MGLTPSVSAVESTLASTVRYVHMVQCTYSYVLAYTWSTVRADWCSSTRYNAERWQVMKTKSTSLSVVAIFCDSSQWTARSYCTISLMFRASALSYSTLYEVLLTSQIVVVFNTHPGFFPDGFEVVDTEGAVLTRLRCDITCKSKHNKRWKEWFGSADPDSHSRWNETRTRTNMNNRKKTI